MADAETISIKLTELLRHPEDLDKIPALKSEFIRKKAAVDGQLKLGLKEQLEITQAGMNSISDSQRTVNLIKEEMMKIDRLCAEAQNMIRDFPNINLVSQTHRNFAQVETMKFDLESFEERLSNLEQLLRQDYADMENQPNLLGIHLGLTQLRDIRDDAMDQIRRASDSSLEGTLQDYFTRLDDVIDWFDDHVGQACMNLIPLVTTNNHGLVVRLALVVAEEERNDKKVKALQDAQREYKQLASRFKSINSGPKQLRGYKEKFLRSIELYAQSQLEATEQQFLEDPEKLEKSMKWFFNDLFVVKTHMVGLMPKKWRIFNTYVQIYHNLMHNWLIKFIDDPELGSVNMLAIIHWNEKYHNKMERLGVSRDSLEPQLIDNREAELVREWRQLIVKSIDEWMDRFFTTDRKAFVERKSDTDSHDNDENGYLRTKTLPLVWRMLHENILASKKSDRMDVTEGVVDAIVRALKKRQMSWQRLIDDQSAIYSNPQSDQDGLSLLQDWLVAIANDQIACIDDNEVAGQIGYLTRFKRDFEPAVSPKFMPHATTELDALRDGYVDLSTHCITTFVSLIFASDFRSTLPDFFTPRWYAEQSMKRITTTFEDYIGDYSLVLHHSMLDIFVEELADELLVRYLSSVRNKGAKFKRTEPFTDKFKDDVLTTFAFFEKFSEFSLIKQKWRVVDGLVRLLEADKPTVASVYETFKREYWDVHLSWIEAVLKSRDDFDRGMLNSVKAKAAEVQVARGPETIMGKVK
ncbi:MAG: SNARE-binding exocyst subunit S6 [Candelina submexicana]|nr:MAG: SNARE-binding exocyst subunit S6 [Candelina submexicana]